MALARWQATIVDEAGNIQDGAAVTVRHETVGTPLASIFSDRDGAVSIGNPLTADSEGFAGFHVAGGAYRITATLGSFTRVWRYVGIGTAAESDIADFVTASVIATGTPASRTVEDHLGDLFSLKDFGAVGDGSTDDTAAVTLADAQANAKFSPSGIYDTTLANTDLDGPYWGRGQIRDADNNERAPWFSAIKTAPASFGVQDSILTAFSGDLSKVQIAMEHRITGAATLGNPATGYSFYPEAGAVFARGFNSSGHNEELDSNVGRTMAQLFNLRVDQAGQGDFACLYAFATVQGTKASSTHFLANPACSIIAAQIDGFTDGVYLNPYELAMSDNGFDVAGIGWVVNMDRSVGTGAKSACWMGFRAQSTGSAEINAHYSAAGPCRVGLDFSAINTDANLAAIGLLANDRIYGNVASSNGLYVTSYGDDWIEFNSGINAWSFVNGNVSQLQIYSGQLVVVPLALFLSNVVLNHTATVAFGGGITPQFQIIGTSGNTAAAGQARYSNGTTGAAYIFSKSRNATPGSHTIVALNDTLGIFHFNGSDGTAFINGAYIEARCTATPGTNDMPTSLIFSTTGDGSATPTEALRIDHTQQLQFAAASFAANGTDVVTISNVRPAAAATATITKWLSFKDASGVDSYIPVWQ